MSVVVVCSAKASPGATTVAAALALGWPASRERPVRIVEADIDGGVLAARFGLRATPNLADLAVAARRGISDEMVADHEQSIADHVALVAAPTSGEQVHAALITLGTAVLDLAADPTVDTVVDAGRVSPRVPILVELCRRAGLVLMVARPRRDEVEAVAARAAMLRDAGAAVGLVGNRVDRGADPVEFATIAGLPLVGVIGEDRRGAAVLTGDTVLNERRLARSALLRHSADVAAAVIDRLRPVPHAAPTVGEVA